MNKKPPMSKDSLAIACSFCGRTEEAVEKLISGQAASQAQYEIAVATFRQAQADVAAQKADVARVKLDLEKAKEWLKKGAQPTDRVARFLTNAGLWNRVNSKNPTKMQPKKKAQERAKERADKAAAAAAARSRSASPAPRRVRR